LFEDLDEMAIRKAFFYLDIIWGIIGVIAMAAVVHAFVTQTGEMVQVLGMVIPRSLLYVLIPCHIILIPWTFYQAYTALYNVDAFLANYPWILIIALILSVTENLFRGPQTYLVMCICLFDWISDVIGIPFVQALYKRRAKS